MQYWSFKSAKKLIIIVFFLILERQPHQSFWLKLNLALLGLMSRRPSTVQADRRLAEAIAEEDAKEAAAKTARSRRQAAERACSATSTAASSDEWSVVGSVSPKLSALEPVVRLAAAEVSARVGSSTVQAPPSHVLGLLPPTPSSSGRRYYALRHHHPGGPGVACGQPIALCWLGGVWIGGCSSRLLGP